MKSLSEKLKTALSKKPAQSSPTQSTMQVEVSSPPLIAPPKPGENPTVDANGEHIMTVEEGRMEAQAMQMALD